MILTVIIFYLALVLTVGMLSHRLFRGTGEDYFLATRSIGSFVLLMSLFGTHMTAFSLLGASGEGYRVGIGVFSLMASSSALVVPVVYYFVGTRLWALGKRHGYVTQVQYFRERWESEAVGLSLFVVMVVLVIPYLLIGVMGGGMTLSRMTDGQVPAWAGSLLVCAVVLCYVTYGGLRGTAWANTFQTLVFMVLGAVTFLWIVKELGGLEAALGRVAAANPELLVRGENIPPLKLLTYLAIPLSVGMFPHIFMHWLTAKRAASFKLPVVGFPICVAIVWLPSVLLGVLGTADIPGLTPAESGSVLVRLIHAHAPGLLAGLLAAGVFAAIMSSLDSQTLSLGTMFTQDIVRRFAGGEGLSERRQVLYGRLFVVGILFVTFLLSLFVSRAIFKLGVWSFTGFSGLFPVVLAALFWKRSTKQGVLACIATVAALWVWFFVNGWSVPGYSIGGTGIIPAAVIPIVAGLVLVAVSLVTPAPRAAVLDKFFPAGGRS